VNDPTAGRIETVYLDSTVLSFLHDRRPALAFQSALTRKWWRKERRRFHLYLSEATLNELAVGSYPAQLAAQRTARRVEALPFDGSLGRIIGVYIKEFVMPREQEGDAAHLAYASYHRMDYLLTWNCKHLANANKFEHIRVVNQKLGLKTPQIVTPMELFAEV
jgi:hypothetical protein